jgi:hypothetical protein
VFSSGAGYKLGHIYWRLACLGDYGFGWFLVQGSFIHCTTDDSAGWFGPHAPQLAVFGFKVYYQAHP